MWSVKYSYLHGFMSYITAMLKAQKSAQFRSKICGAVAAAVSWEEG
jgi:hypothetical protein